MKQTKLISLVETITNVSIGFFVSLAIWYVVIIPLFDIELCHAENITITLIFTVASIARGYLIRRYFANEMHLIIVDVIKRLQK